MKNLKEIIIWIQSKLSVVFADLGNNKALLVIFKYSDGELYLSALLSLLISGLLVFNLKIILSGTQLGFFKSKLKLGLFLSLIFLILMVLDFFVILMLLSLAKALNLLILVTMVSLISIIKSIGEGQDATLLMNNGPAHDYSSKGQDYAKHKISGFLMDSGSGQGSSSGQPYSGQPYSGQPYSGQPYSWQPYPGQPYPGQPYIWRSYSGSIPGSSSGRCNYAPSLTDLWNYALGINSQTSSSEPLVDASINSFLRRNPIGGAPQISSLESRGFDGSIKSILNSVSDANTISDKHKYPWPYSAEQEANTDLKTSITEKFISTLREGRKFSFWARASTERHLANFRSERDYLHNQWIRRINTLDIRGLESLESLELEAQKKIQHLLIMTTNSREYLLDISLAAFTDANEAKLVIHKEYNNILQLWIAHRAEFGLSLHNLNLNRLNEPDYWNRADYLKNKIEQGNEVIEGLNKDLEHINNLFDQSVFDKSKAKSWIKPLQASEGFFIVERDREHQSLLQVKAELFVLEDKISQYVKKRSVISAKLDDKKTYSQLIRQSLWAEEERIVSELLKLNTSHSEYLKFLNSKNQ